MGLFLIFIWFLFLCSSCCIHWPCWLSTCALACSTTSWLQSWQLWPYGFGRPCISSSTQLLASCGVWLIQRCGWMNWAEVWIATWPPPIANVIASSVIANAHLWTVPWNAHTTDIIDISNPLCPLSIVTISSAHPYCSFYCCMLYCAIITYSLFVLLYVLYSLFNCQIFLWIKFV